jgi:arylsulfatase A-like enzyme
MNIVYMHCHDAGRMVEPYGYNVSTPNLQRFAENGVTFRQAFCAAPSCSPSRVALLTGQYPHTAGMFGLASPYFGFELQNKPRHLANFLREHGYETVIAGNQHECHGPLGDPNELGYEHWLNHTPDGKPINSRTVGEAVSYIEKPHDKPFFLAVGFNTPHRENGNAGRRHCPDADIPNVEDLDGRYTRPPAPIPDTPTTRQDWESFRIAQKRLDEKMGAVIDAIDRRGLREETLIIVTTDHGFAWPHGKGNLTDLGLGVMLMMRGPRGSGFEGGRVLDAMVSHMDVYPMLCEWLKLDPPDWLQGTSLLPLIDGRAESIHDHLFCEQSWHGWGYDPQRGVRTDRYKYIRRKDTEHLRIVDPGPTNDWLASLGYRKRPQETELLYDLWFDPVEMNNLADDPEHAQILADLRGKVDRWLEETNDPFVTDTIPKPVDVTK